MRFITGLVFLFLLLAPQADAQPGALFNGDSAIYRQHHVRARHAHNGDSATKGGNVQTFDRAGRLLADARLNGNGDTLDRNTYAYNAAGDLISQTWFTKDVGTRYILNSYKAGKLIESKSEFPGGKSWQHFVSRYTYTADGKPDSILICKRGQPRWMNNMGESGLEDVYDTIRFSYSGDTTRTWYSFMSAEKEYLVKDSAGHTLVLMKSQYGAAFYPYETFTYDAAGRPVRLERRLNDGKPYMWETYCYDERGLLIRMEYFQANISTEKPTAVHVYSYTFY